MVYVIPPTRMTIKFARSNSVVRLLIGLRRLIPCCVLAFGELWRCRWNKREYIERLTARCGTILPFSTTLLAVSGRKVASSKRWLPDVIANSQNIHRHDRLWDRTPPMTGPRLGAAFVKPSSTPTNDPRFSGIEISAIIP
jgi:hypothetical protein